MKKEIKVLFYFFAVVFVVFFITAPVQGEVAPNCEQGDQDSGSIYRICMPPAGIQYNGRLVAWAHGFQDAGPGVEIPEGQLCFQNTCIDEMLNGLGYAFATNSYSKKGLAVKQGVDDIIDLISIFTDNYGEAEKVYLIGASEGGLITALIAENHSDVLDATFALCAPNGDFPYQINYLGDARVTFEYFFPNIIPGYGVFNEIDKVDIDGDGNVEYVTADYWDAYFTGTIGPLLASKPWKLKQWAKVAKLPFDLNDKFNTTLFSAMEVLRFSVIHPNLEDAISELGGMPFNNRWKWYTGSYNDFRVNRKVKRLTPSAAAIIEMKDHYNTSGALEIPLITAHTLLDPQVPYFHATIYNLKTIATGSFLTDHVNIPIDRYGHCNFTLDEALGGFALMLLYAGDWQMLAALQALMEAQ